MLANHKGEIPFVIFILPFLLGITLGLNFAGAAYLHFFICSLLLISLVFILLNVAYRSLNLYKIKWVGGILIHITLFLCGLVSVLQYNELNSGHHFSKTTTDALVVKINNEPIIKNGLVRFTASVETGIINAHQLPVNGTLLIAIKDTTANHLYYGDELLIPAKYAAIEPPYNPGEFNYKRYLANQNIFYQAFLYPKQFRLIGNNKGNPIIAYSLRLRQRLIEKLKRNMHDTSAISVASTLILGYKADLSSDILQAYSKTGTIHVLSVSGAHVAIIYILLNLIFGFLNKHKYGKLFKALLIICVIWYYSLLSGFSPAVCRAAVMISMVIIGKTLSRYINTLNILALSAFLLLLYDPLFITDVGFQLSYLAVGGLIVFQPIVYRWFTFKNKWIDKLWAVCSVSIAAQLITFPLSAFYFHQFPVYFLISNLFIIIPSAVIMYVGIAYLMIPQMPVVSSTLGYLLEKSILFMNRELAIIEHTPFASIGKIWLNTVEYLLAYLIIVCLFYFLFDKKKWLIKMGLIAMLLLCISISFKKANAMEISQITFLNMKKHSGIVFKSGNDAIVLADLKADDKNYQYEVQPGLDSTQITSTSVFNINDDVSNTLFIKKDNLIQFRNKRILIFDKHLQNKLLAKKLKIDYIYVTGNPSTTLNMINNNYAYQTIIIDGSNSDRLIKRLKDQAETGHINYKVLKRNNSFSVLSN
jgi:competence protein ComEC